MTTPKAPFLLRFSDRFRRRQEGQGMVEYALILVLVSIVAIIAVSSVGQQTSNALASVNSGLSGTHSSAGGPTVTGYSDYSNGYSAYSEICEGDFLEVYGTGFSTGNTVKLGTVTIKSAYVQVNSDTDMYISLPPSRPPEPTDSP
jgi:pilus assembly protein Flp/PilA